MIVIDAVLLTGIVFVLLLYIGYRICKKWDGRY